MHPPLFFVLGIVMLAEKGRYRKNLHNHHESAIAKSSH